MGPTLSSEPFSSKAQKDLIGNSTKETLFILDWDDTLMCTSFIRSKSQPLSKEDQSLISKLGYIVSAFISHCQKYGKVIILTNSSENWVKRTASENLGIVDLFNKKIKIFSTRDNYYKKGIDIKYWKEMALDEIFNKRENKIENLICASDSEKDINTFKNFIQKHRNVNISTINFKRTPDPLIMIKEIKYLINCIGKIIGTNKNYFLMKEDKEKNTEEFNFLFGNLLDYLFPN